MIALAAAYVLPVVVSLVERRKQVSGAQFHWPSLVGWTVNILAVAWVAFQLVLFSMPTALPVTLVTMNWASVVFVGFMAIAAVYYVLFARRGKINCDLLGRDANRAQCIAAHQRQMGYREEIYVKGSVCWQYVCRRIVAISDHLATISEPDSQDAVNWVFPSTPTVPRAQSEGRSDHNCAAVIEFKTLGGVQKSISASNSVSSM